MIAVRFRFPAQGSCSWRYVDMMLPAVPRADDQVVIAGHSFIVAKTCWELEHPHLVADSDRQFVVEPNVTVYLRQ